MLAVFCSDVCVVLHLPDPMFVLPSSVICHELDQPRTAEEDEKSEDLKENEKDATERRKIRGEI